MANPKPGSFSAYLEYSQRSTESAPRPVSEPTSLLTIIRRADGPIQISDLAGQSKMSATAFHDALQKLVDSGFIELSGSPLPESVRLTDKGHEVAKLFD